MPLGGGGVRATRLGAAVDGNLRAWRPPEGVGSVLIAADRGRDGEASAAQLAAALRAGGWICAVRLPPAPFGDWNEAAGFRVRAS